MLISLTVALSPAALAHRPHDDAPGFAFAPDFETTGRAWTVLDPHDVSQLMRTDDHGRHWDFVCGDNMEDALIDVGYDGDTLVLLGEDGTVWRSDDEGESWTSSDVPGSDLVVVEFDIVDGQALIATSGGLFHGDIADAASMDVAFEGENVSAVHIGTSGTWYAALPEGQLHVSSDQGATWSQELAMGALEFYALQEVAGTLYIGTSTLGVLAFDATSGTAGQCLPLPVTETGDYTFAISELADLGDNLLLAANGYQAVFASASCGGGWELLATPDEVEYDGIGMAADPRQAFTHLGWSGGVGVVTGFSGISVTEDDGASWYEAKMVPEDYARGVAFAPDFPDDPRIFVGGYGGGATWTWDGGASWEGSAHAMIDAYSYDVQPTVDLSETGTVWFSGSLAPYRSRDGGETWELLRDKITMQRSRAYRSYSADRTWMLGENSAEGVEGQVEVSYDDGDTWEPLDSLHAQMQGAVPRDVQETVVDGRDAIVVVADAPPSVFLSFDDGATWATSYERTTELAGISSAGLGAWPPGEGARLVLADPDIGVLHSDDAGASWQESEVDPDGRPRQLTMADDGTLFLLLRSGQIHRSVDGGDSWEAVGEPIRAAIHDLVTAPRFAETGTLLAGTQDGVFWSDDRGESWFRIPRFERFEDQSHHLSCEIGAKAFRGCGGGCATSDDALECATYSDDSHGMGGGYLLYPGDVARFTFSGQGFRVLGLEEGELEVRINGSATTTLSAGDLEVDGLGEGWKDVELLATSGDEGVRIDAVEAWGEGEVLPIDGALDTADSGDTGPDDSGEVGDSGDTGGPTEPGCCHQDGEAALVVAFPLLLALRRRRRS